jgi:hypothetical protein
MGHAHQGNFVGDGERAGPFFSLLLAKGKGLHETGEICSRIGEKTVDPPKGEEFQIGLGNVRCFHFDPIHCVPYAISLSFLISSCFLWEGL